MLGKTAIDVAKLKIHVAPQVMNLKALVRKTMANGRRFRLLQHFQRRLLPLGETQSGRQSDPGPAPVHIVRRSRDSRFEGRDRFSGGAHVAQGVAAQAHGFASDGRIPGQLYAAIGQS